VIELSDPQWLARPRRFDRGPVCVGRSKKQSHVPVPKEALSRVHAVIDLAGGRWWIVEVGKMRLTKLNDTLLAPGAAAELHSDDVVSFDGVAFGVRIRSGVTGRPNPPVEDNPLVSQACALIAEHAKKTPAG
jgi:hypothetical protein